MRNSRTLTIENAQIEEDFAPIAGNLPASWASQPQILLNAVFENTGAADLLIASYPDDITPEEVLRADYKTLVPQATLQFARVNLAKVYLATADDAENNELEIYGDQI